jgi:beta-glucosidase
MHGRNAHRRTRAAIAAGVSAGAARRPSDASRRAASKVADLMAAMTLDEKISFVHGAADPASLGQAGYIPGVARLGVPPADTCRSTAGRAR